MKESKPTAYSAWDKIFKGIVLWIPLSFWWQNNILEYINVTDYNAEHITKTFKGDC